jgi:hypothetical protein
MGGPVKVPCHMRPKIRQEISFRAENLPIHHGMNLFEALKAQAWNYENVSLLVYIFARQVKASKAQCYHTMVQHGTSAPNALAYTI